MLWDVVVEEIDIVAEGSVKSGGGTSQRSNQASILSALS